jgi:CHAD domain-containing protein
MSASLPSESTSLPSLDPGERADTALRQVLKWLLAALRRNEPGLKAAADPECLHDYRVAVRRTRALLGQLKEVFPETTTQRYAQKFAGLGDITGRPRDLDVYLLEFEQHRAELPEAMRADLDPLREYLDLQAATAHALLNKQLDAPDYARWLRRWELFLEQPPPRRARARQAALPVKALVSRRVWKLYRRLVDEGGAIAADGPPEPLHDLRKTAKKLRYLLELFRSLYPPEKLAPLIKALKGLQDQLGAYQDAHAQIAQLREFAEALREAGAPTPTLLALGALLEQRYVWEQRLRKEFPEHFAKFAGNSVRRKFRRLFKAEERAL